MDEADEIRNLKNPLSYNLVVKLQNIWFTFYFLFFVPLLMMDRDVYLGAFVFGLAGSNQHTAVFYAAPITLLILFWGRKQLFNMRDISMYVKYICAGGGLCGMLVLL